MLCILYSGLHWNTAVNFGVDYPCEKNEYILMHLNH